MQNKTLLITILFISICSISFAGQLTIQSSFPDLNPGDGFFEAGSISNPLIVQNDHGITVGTVRSSFPDLNPGDGFFEAGSTCNPMIVDFD